MSIETIILIGLIIVVSAFTYLIVRYTRKHLEKVRARDAERAEMIRKYRSSPPKPTPQDYASHMSSAGGVARQRTSTTVPSYRTDDVGDRYFDVLNGALLGATIGEILRGSGDAPASSSETTSSSSQETSWGFDDEDSRNSVSSSMDTTSSWDNSSDSSPSSDW